MTSLPYPSKMKSLFSSWPSTILIYVLMLSTSLASSSTTSHDLIEQICKKTPFYDLCVTALHSSSESSGADIKGLASIVANLILSDATDTLNYIEGLIKQAKDPKLQRQLADCAELYIPLVKYNLPQSIDAFNRGQYGFATYVLSDAAKQADECEKNFSGSKVSPVSDRNKLVSNLCDVAVAIIKMLVKR